MKPEMMTDRQLEAATAEAARRGLIDIDLSDVAPDRLAAAALATPEGRSAVARLHVAKRKTAGQKALDPAKVQAMRNERLLGAPVKLIADRHGVCERTVLRYTRDAATKRAS